MPLAASVVASDLELVHRDFPDVISYQGLPINGFIVSETDLVEGSDEPSESVVSMRSQRELPVGAEVRVGLQDFAVRSVENRDGAYVYRLRRL